ncbi:MAG: LysR family transcriptional regulator [Coriobacteriia bacterium]|nr:LysR family transcriptional regulator [Coriobacteriia bacterium]
MTIVQLEYLIAIIQEGGIKAAAATRFVTRQAVINSIRDLEEELDVKLLKKDGRTVVPTEAARQLYPLAIEALASVDKVGFFAKRLSGEQGVNGTITIAVKSSLLRGSLLSCSGAKAIKNAFECATIDISYCTNSDCIYALKNGAADLAIVLGRVDDLSLNSVKVFDLCPYIGVSKSNPLANKASMSVLDLAGVPIAAPEDMSYCFGAYGEKLREHGIQTEFTSLQPTLQAHQNFLDKGGAIFMSNAPRLLNEYNDLVMLSISPATSFSFPVHVVHRKSEQESLAYTISSYVMDSKKSDLFYT